jgi:glycosyltransferase involved in cell wall biosynthesis
MILISLIIPTRNRVNDIQRLLKSIKNNISAKNIFEVIVIDNGSTDETKLVCQFYKDIIPNFIYCYDDEPGLLTGRHHGATLASGEVLCFLDDDVILNSTYVESVYNLFADQKNLSFATGPCLPQYEVEPPEWLNYFWEYVTEGKYCAWLSLLDFGNELKKINPNYVMGLNFCCRKDILFKLGGFHPDCIPKHLQQFQGDGETGLTQKAIKAKMLAIYDPKLSVQHRIPKERLTHEYFKKRAYYKGVCDSFKILRTKHFVQPLTKPNKLKLVRNKLHPFYRWIKKIYTKDKSIHHSEAIKKLQGELEKSTQEGFKFHQESYHSNELVKIWVLKENYWDYKLPISV